ncbi:helix-turn-helix domain-containing protein [Streptomyces hesseae]|uniref:Helix-turn-helix transcriptional regulator n=1 Tax=Streptomyces hesseae TaxID=3075519 RepID=A0ABU2SW24_9ACTN|nr:helix-turn-helix transcriptional regulator [Streptomyces sp. DSM 40473]MDT0453208.1 helix-turn-helix transcriptional regulator [Streptomyces sp. DSM 40473]
MTYTRPRPMAWQYCGEQIKLWRNLAGVSRETLAQEAGYGCDTIASVEQGRRRPAIHLLRIADQLCGAKGLLRAAEKYLEPEPLPECHHDYMQYETEAIVISSYQPLIIPGLLQTEEYAQAQIGGYWPPLDEQTVEERVANRMNRQALLDDQTRVFNYVIGEPALRFPIASQEQHRRQLHHLLEMSERRNVTIQALRFGGIPGGNEGSLILLETLEHKHLAYQEGHLGAALTTDPGKVSKATQRLARLTQQAMNSVESTCFIKELADTQ